jgi:hypothetical protein
VTKGKKKAKNHTQAQNKSRCVTEVFYGPVDAFYGQHTRALERADHE